MYRTPHSEGTNRDETIAKRLKAFNWIELVHKTMLCFAHICTSANQRRRSYVFISINPLKMSVCMRARLNVTHSMQCSVREREKTRFYDSCTQFNRNGYFNFMTWKFSEKKACTSYILLIEQSLKFELRMNAIET